MTLRQSALLLGLIVVVAACSTPSGSGTAGPGGSVPDITTTDEPGTSEGAPTPTPITGTGFCDPASLYAEIISWDAGAGHRTATVQLTNIGDAGCKVHSLAKPQLIGGDGAVLIQGTDPTSNTVLTVAPNDVLTSMVQDANYCGPTPAAPITVAFILPSGEGRVIANPVSPDDVEGLPPCNGSGSGDIEMQPWSPAQ
jgi:hypothetical protein